MARSSPLTANPDKAVEWGVDETRVLPFNEGVGGRYSLWSSIGFPAALGLGWGVFEGTARGCGGNGSPLPPDRAARKRPPRSRRSPTFIIRRVRKAETRAPFAYDQRLQLLPSYLQQLEMESNGKGVTVDGKPVGRPTAAITWGGVGTEAQHAVVPVAASGHASRPRRIPRGDREAATRSMKTTIASCCSTRLRRARR